PLTRVAWPRAGRSDAPPCDVGRATDEPQPPHPRRRFAQRPRPQALLPPRPPAGRQQDRADARPAERVGNRAYRVRCLTSRTSRLRPERVLSDRRRRLFALFWRSDAESERCRIKTGGRLARQEAVRWGIILGRHKTSRGFRIRAGWSCTLCVACSFDGVVMFNHLFSRITVPVAGCAVLVVGLCAGPVTAADNPNVPVAIEQATGRTGEFQIRVSDRSPLSRPADVSKRSSLKPAAGEADYDLAK